ncbi:MAG: serine/threonine protein kinase [Bradymonadaceae bacterium]|nr:serine/threonine protein kinase [Lujinxingiaceae bacterium]
MAQPFPQSFGPYTLHELVARGGMAEIYRATMPGIGGFEKTVAIKKILPHLAENEEFITMLIDEARIIVSINHFNIAQVYDLGRIDDTYYIAMEFIHGVDLSGIIKTLAKQSRFVPFDHAAYIGSGICAGLHVAHSKADERGRPLNIVHRDISPHNVLLSFAGDVKIIDFGVAKASVKETHTQMGVIKGKLLYMAPEQAMAKEIDGRADLFAAGLVIYKMLTNRLPFEGDNEFQIYNNILSKDVVPPRAINPEVPEEFNAIVMKMLSREPDDRYQDGYAAKQALDRLLYSISPGYTVNRLSRYVEDNFSNLVVRNPSQQESSGPSGLSPKTPSSNQHATGQQIFDDLPEIGLDSIDDVRETVDLASAHPGLNPGFGAAQRPSSVPFGGPPTSNFRASTGQEDTGQFQVPVAAGAPETAQAKRGLPPAAYAVIGVGLLIAALLAYTLVVSKPPVEPEGDVAVAPVVVRAPKAFVTVHLETNPDGASLYRDNSFVGITPITLDLENSEQPITYAFRKEGYVERVVSLVPDDDISHTIELVADEGASDEPEEVAADIKVEPAKVEPAKVEPAKVAAQPVVTKTAPVREVAKTAPQTKTTTRTKTAPTEKKVDKANDWFDVDATPTKKKTTEKKKGSGANVDILDPFDL